MLFKLVRQMLTVGIDVFQQVDVSDCYGLSLDRLSNSSLYLWYG